MAQAAVRLGDQCTGHGCFPPRVNIEASGNVFINSIGAHRVGDGWAVHCCGPVCHGGSQATGSSTVFVNGKASRKTSVKGPFHGLKAFLRPFHAF